MGKLTVNTIEDNGNNTIVTADGLGDVTVRANTIDAVTGTSSLTLGGTNATSITLGSGASFSNVSGQNYPAFSARGTSDQTVSATTFTDVTFPTEEFDTDGGYATSTGRFTVPSGKAGKYFFSVQGEAKNLNGGIGLYWVINNVIQGSHTLTNYGTVSTDDPGVCMTALYDLSDGDEIGVQVYRGTAGDIRYKWFQGFRIGS